MDGDPAAVVSEYFSRMRARDASVVDLFDDDAFLLGLGAKRTGREAIREFYTGIIHGARPSPSLVGELMVEGSRVAAEIRIELPGGAEVHAVDLFRVEDGRQLLTRSHVDIAFLALLWQTEQGGLQMKGADGRWREAPAVPSGLSVHCGDLLEPLTDGRIRATLHRVVGHNGERRSLGYWLEPNFETEIVSPSDGQTVSYAQYMVDQFPDRFVSPQ